MTKILWYLNRLKCMNLKEIFWRINQKYLGYKEMFKFKNKVSITDTLFNKRLNELKIDIDKLCLNLNNKDYSLNYDISLLGNYEYKRYKMQWNAGFQTNNNWPINFSYKLNYKGKDDIGDARTNWELNRHYQFVKLVKNYYITNDKKYLYEFEKLFNDWNEKNPFLYGISWTSVMELAIRINNWTYTYYYLKQSNVSDEILKKIEIGILNMTYYITKHYSRYSSANNHLIVEIYAIGQSGILFNYKPWIDFSINTLTKELIKQNYKDGVNKEVSLHYQAFSMEAIGLFIRLLIKNNIEVPIEWYAMLDKMCSYLKNCLGKYNEVIKFGDDDNGKILELGDSIDYYNYILSLYSCILNCKYTDYNCENIKWLFDESILYNKEYKRIHNNICYKDGGISILRSDNEDILIGIDHGELGFGKIAAHGHADALSFQIFYKGEPLFLDLGTYIYHSNIDKRNYYRKTINHNTITINNKDQSEMLGAFLWGKRAKCRLIEYKDSNSIKLIAEHNGYKPIIHRREFEFNKKDTLVIIDKFNGNAEKVFNLNLHPNAKVKIEKNNIKLDCYFCKVKIIFESKEKNKPLIVNKKYSPRYGIEENIKSIQLKTYGDYIKTIIKIEEK